MRVVLFNTNCTFNKYYTIGNSTQIDLKERKKNINRN